MRVMKRLGIAAKRRKGKRPINGSHRDVTPTRRRVGKISGKELLILQLPPTKPLKIAATTTVV